jgi:hypothetical protein
VLTRLDTDRLSSTVAQVRAAVAVARPAGRSPARGALRVAVEAQDAGTAQALVRLETTALDALQEVENALVNYHRKLERRAALEAAPASNTTAA